MNHDDQIWLRRATQMARNILDSPIGIYRRQARGTSCMRRAVVHIVRSGAFDEIGGYLRCGHGVRVEEIRHFATPDPNGHGAVGGLLHRGCTQPTCTPPLTPCLSISFAQAGALSWGMLWRMETCMRSTRLTAPTILLLLVALPAQAQNGAPRARCDAAGHKVGGRSRSELTDQKGAALPNNARDGES